jgi:2-polyprenyl-3-methyl-5-hydroxy-6-metoxy-1,4-benzoquinol methylase
MAKYGPIRRKRVRELVKQFVPRGQSILEVSCGRGEILKGLQEEGYTVQGTNYTRYPDCHDSIPVDTGVDILRGLPYESGTYDCVILSDVIEHLSDHAAALRDIARIAKNGGYVIVVTPNMMKINSRINFLLTGFFKVNQAFIGFDVPLNRSFGFHLYPAHLPTFLYQLRANNVEAVLIDAVGYKMKSYLQWLMFIPFILPATYLKTHALEKNLKRSTSSRLLFKSLVSFKTLCGESWVVVGRKRGADTVEQQIGTHVPTWTEKF